MTHPDDNSAFLRAADEIREYEYQRGYESRDDEVAALTAERDAARAEYADHMTQAHGDGGTPDPDPDPDPEQPPGVRDLVRVRVFPHYAKKNYGQHDKVLALLDDLGCGVSGLLTPGMGADEIRFYQRAYEATGVKTWFTVGQPHKPLTKAQWDDIEATLTGPLKGMVDLCSGWNEPNHVRGAGSPPADWRETTAAHQAELWRRLPRHGLRVGSPQLWSGNFADHDADLASLAPAIRGKFDTIAWHLYPRGKVNAPLVDRWRDTYFKHFGQMPVACTEGGYSTGGSGGNPVTEAQQADLWPKHIRLYTDRGWGMSVFELLDDPAGGREGFLGIVRADWTPKPAFHAIKALLA